MSNTISEIDFDKNHEEWVKIYHSHEDDGHDGGAGFHTWQIEIFERILEHIGEDEEARVTFLHTINFAQSKSRCAGFPG